MGENGSDASTHEATPVVLGVESKVRRARGTGRILGLSVVLTATWMRLARRALRHDRVLLRLSVVLTATWMRLARGALRADE